MAGYLDPFTRAAAITAAFYNWEERGRGWRVWPEPVEIEPPFRPFVRPRQRVRLPDDGRRHTFLSSLLERVGFGTQVVSPAPEEIEDEPEPRPFSYSGPLVELQLSLPPDCKFSPDVPAQFLLSLGACREPVSFEIAGAAQSITIQFVGTRPDVAVVRQQMLAHFPEIVAVESSETLSRLFRDAAVIRVIECGLANEFMQPLRNPTTASIDPLVPITAALSSLRDSEVGVLQVLFARAKAPWASETLSAVSDWNGESILEDATNLPKLAAAKCSTPLYAAVIRVAAGTASPVRSFQIAQGIVAALGQFADPVSNELIPLGNNEYPDSDHEADLVCRVSRRSGCVLNLDEMSAVVRLPSPAVRVASLSRQLRRTKAAPAFSGSDGIVIGTNTHLGLTKEVKIPLELRMRHTHLVGASGTGKSTLLLNMMIQDMKHGHALALLDPHGDLVDQVLAHVPDDRIDDVVLVDPADIEYPVGFNILSAHSDLEKTLLASDLVAIFRRLSTTWGDQMTSVLSNAILAFLESSRGGSIADLRRFLVEAEFRKDFLHTVRDPEVLYYWQKEFPLLSGKPQAPLLTRLDAFLRPRPVRGMVTHVTSLDFSAIMNDGKILLVKLAQGAIGEENAALLGSLFVAKIHQLALGRQAIAEAERRPFFVYMDEFQHFVTPSMATLLTGARKYGVGLVLAHQELRQLSNQDRDVAGAVLANAATRIYFRVGDDDAKALEDGFAGFSTRDIQNLGVGQAICRVDRVDSDFSLDAPAPLIATPDSELSREQVVRHSRERYGARNPVVDPIITPPPDPVTEEARHAASRSASSPVPHVSAPPPSPTNPTATAAAPFPWEGPSKTPTTPGRGGSQHKYLQELIRRWAEANGWRATIEKPILAGLGSVDVALERDNQSVACEIGCSTSLEHELDNVQKCLASGFTYVCAIMTDQRRLTKMMTAVKGLPANVYVLDPSQLFEFLSSRLSEVDSSEKVRGYRVTVRQQTSGHASKSRRSVAETILAATNRLRGRS